MRILVVTNMYPTGQMPYYGTFVREQVESLRQQGVQVDVLFVNGSSNKLNYLLAFPRLWARLLTKRYDLIHAHYVFSGIIARAQLVCPVILTHHGSQVFDGWQAPVCRIVSKFMDRVIVVSPEMKERGGLRKSLAIPCGVDFDLFKPMPRGHAREELGLPQGKRLVVFVGEYYKANKRWDIIQAAVELLRKTDPEVELVLVSKKPLNVVPKYLNACDVLVLASNGEGSPQVIKEAMACNLPVVSVAVGDVPAVIGDTPGCFLCSQDPRDVADKLELALQRGKRTDGRQRVRHLELGAISRRVISVYQDVLLRKRSRRWKSILLRRGNMVSAEKGSTEQDARRAKTIRTEGVSHQR